MSIRYSDDDEVWQRIKSAFDAKQPISLGTYGESEEARYAGSGIYANHSYSVLGYSVRNGERYVKIRNPWAESEPRGNGANDGIFELKLADVMRYYSSVYST